MDKNINSVGILYVAIGKYTMFFDKFYQSCEENLFPGVKKNYYVFTDSDIPLKEYVNNIKVLSVNNEGWPGNTLFRYHMFLQHFDKLDEDFLLFLNANTEVVKPVQLEEIVPEKGKCFTVAHHPYYYQENNLFKLPFEKNPESKAYVSDFNFKYTYVGGGFIGGYRDHFLNLTKHLVNSINEDLKNKIVAQWHDESHFNKFINEYNGIVYFKTPEYFYPLEFKINKRNVPDNLKDIEEKIVIIPKELLGGHSFLRNKNNHDNYLLMFNNSLVQEMHKIKLTENTYSWIKIYNDDIFDTRRFKTGRIVDRGKDYIDVIWDNEGLQKLKLEIHEG